MCVLMSLICSAKPRKSTPKPKSPTPIVDDMEMNSEIGDEEGARNEEVMEDEDEGRFGPAVDMDDDSQNLHDEYGKG